MTEIFATHHFPSGQNLSIGKGDLTREQTDAIVNAANSQLMHGGGVAAAIARRGGEAIDRESREWVKDHGLVTHAQPAVTTGGNLPCEHVIHAVGPVWGEGDEDRELAEAILGSLTAAENLNAASVALPAISTGIYGFPKDRAARIFIQTIRQYYQDHPGSIIADTRIVLMDDVTLQEFLMAFKNEFGTMKKE